MANALWNFIDHLTSRDNSSRCQTLAAIDANKSGSDSNWPFIKIFWRVFFLNSNFFRDIRTKNTISERVIKFYFMFHSWIFLANNIGYRSSTFFYLFANFVLRWHLIESAFLGKHLIVSTSTHIFLVCHKDIIRWFSCIIMKWIDLDIL